MRFIYPSFLWALSLVIIPILIHLFNFRRHQTVYFSNVDFLKRVKKESQRKSKIKQLLIMASRIAMIAFMVIAFAQPYIPRIGAEKQNADKAVCIYIDNSFSMNAETPQGRAIDNAKSKALTIINASQPGTSFAILTNDLFKRHHRFYSKKEVVGLINEVDISQAITPMSVIHKHFDEMLSAYTKKTDKIVYYISDFQKYSSDIDNFISDSTLSINAIPLQINTTQNLYIDSCWFDNPAHFVNQIETLNVKVVNSSDQNYQQIVVNLYINDSIKSLTTINLDPNEEKQIQFTYTNSTTGVQRGKVELSDYPIVYDNSIYLSYQVEPKINLLVLQTPVINDRATSYFKALFGTDDFVNIEFTDAERIQISSFKKYSGIILSGVSEISSGLTEELIKYVENGGSLIVFPESNGNFEQYNQLLSRLNCNTITSIDTSTISISEINHESPIFKDVFKTQTERTSFPSVKKHFKFTQEPTIVENVLLGFENGNKALAFTPFKQGKIYTFAFGLNDANNTFPEHLLFVPTLYSIALHTTAIRDLYKTISFNLEFSIDSPVQLTSSDNIKMTNTITNKDFIPTSRIVEGNQIQIYPEPTCDPGFYDITSGSSLISSIAINYNLKESELKYLSQVELNKLFDKKQFQKSTVVDTDQVSFANTIEKLDRGEHFWKIFIAISLLFLLIEMLIIRLWR